MSDSNGTARLSAAEGPTSLSLDGPVGGPVLRIDSEVFPRPKPLDVSQLSSHQRSVLLEAMHAQLNLLTTQVNALTQRCQQLTDQNLAIKSGTELIAARVDGIGWSLRSRLLWLLTGR